ncbi:MAG: four helix bundle protein [Clostridia bacterium]|nr:four helix bundle protein [Clostridia bacterium]
MENRRANELTLIPKSERYIQYMIEVILKLPRTEKFNIGNEYKVSMYKMVSYIMYLPKIEQEKRLEYINLIDAELNIQRMFLRIMEKNRWIDEKKVKVSMDLIYEIGKIVGGLTKYYAKNNKK